MVDVGGEKGEEIFGVRHSPLVHEWMHEWMDGCADGYMDGHVYAKHE